MVYILKFNAFFAMSALASLIAVSAVPIVQPFEGNGNGRTTHLKVLGGIVSAAARPSSVLGGAKAAPSTVLNAVAPSLSMGLAATQPLGVSSVLVEPSQSPVAAAATQTVTQTLVVTVSSPPVATVTVTVAQAQVDPQATGEAIDGVAGGSAGVAITPTFALPVPNLPAVTRVTATGPKREDTPPGSGPKVV
ncbi:hypothetical protein EYR40_001617 [Pleurotus pulmonarius]|nr:hypothetical protein EYR36_000024 [Pleurotus pulmonarius]KAF4604437.1 hypothetical protein EYR38_004859 [Pleurotus pulmonarius]KAF4609264.1 hypothetical protein EYR40_001617 [Pleurotus pulmonarius]